MPIALIACLLSFASQDPLAGVSAKPITLTIRARPLRRLLPELSVSVGTTLTVAPNLADEVVLVHAGGKPAREVVTKVAETLFATWVPNGDGLTLTRTAEDRKRMVADDFRELTRMYDEEFGNTNKALESHPILTEKSAKVIAANEEVANNSEWSDDERFDFELRHGPEPWYRLMARVTGQLLKDMMTIRVTERRVYSSQPTAMQVALPPSVFAACRQYLSEEVLLDRARYALPKKRGASDLISSDFPQVPPSKPQDLARVLVVVTPDMFGFDVEVKMLNANGVAMGESTSTSLRQKGTSLPEVPAEPLQLSPTSQGILEGYRKSESADPTPVPAFVRVLLHPEEHDPADGVPSDVILQRGALPQRSIVAWIPDGPDIYTYLSSVTWTLRQAWEFYYATMDAVEEGGWMKVRPTFPSQLEYPTYSRSVVGLALRRSTSSGRVTLESLLNLNPISRMSLSAIRIRGALLYPLQTNPGVDFQIAEFIAKLDATQMRDALGSGLPGRRLTSEQMAMLEAMAYGEFQSLKFEPPADLDLPELMKEESTEYAPNGLGSGVLTLRWSDELVVSPPRTGANTGRLNRTRAFNSEELAQMTVSAEKSNYEIKEGPDLDRLRIGTRRSLTLSFTLDARRKMEDVLTDVIIGEPTSWERMPASFRKEFESHLAKLRSGSEDGDGHGDGRVAPTQH